MSYVLACHIAVLVNYWGLLEIQTDIENTSFCRNKPIFPSFFFWRGGGMERHFSETLSCKKREQLLPTVYLCMFVTSEFYLFQSPEFFYGHYNVSKRDENKILLWYRYLLPFQIYFWKFKFRLIQKQSLIIFPLNDSPSTLKLAKNP